MFRYLNITSISVPSNTKEWIEAYKKTLINILWFGLLLFIGGIYIFPNDSGTQQTFYLLVALPFLLLFPLVFKEIPWKSKYLYIYMAFPIYMFVSHFWAVEENITRSWTFFFKQIVCFFLFFCCVFLVLKYKPNFVINVFCFLIIVGFLSTCISLLDFYLKWDGSPYYYLHGFSIVDVDKASAIHAIHFSFCLAAALIANTFLRKSVFYFFLIFALVLDWILIYFTQTLGGPMISTIAFVSVILYKIRNIPLLFYVAFFLCCITTIMVIILFYEQLISGDGISIRIYLIIDSLRQWLDSPYFGKGLSYKSPIYISEANATLPHAHTIIADVLRFGGLVGLILFLIHISYPLVKVWNSEAKNSLFLILWVIGGLAASLFYAQQPYVRPGSYVWFFYWMPLTLSYVSSHSIDENNY